MLHYVCISRMEDGLPLSATTDLNPSSSIIDSQKCAKILLRKAFMYPDRLSLETYSHLIHMVSSMSLSFLVLCDKDYPPVLAFCFLDEIVKEFLLQYAPDKICKLHRPYSLIDFDTTMHKLKQRYNNPHSLATRINLSDMSTELKLRPPFQLTQDDIQPYRNGPSNNYAQAVCQVKMPFSSQHFHELSWIERILLALLVICGFLNLVRGVMTASDNYIDDTNRSSYTYSIIFLITGTVFLHQIYILLCHTKWRLLLAICDLLFICLCHLFLYKLRTLFQIFFQVGIASAGTFAVLRRALQPKQPHYNV